LLRSTEVKPLFYRFVQHFELLNVSLYFCSSPALKGWPSIGLFWLMGKERGFAGQRGGTTDETDLYKLAWYSLAKAVCTDCADNTYRIV
jgi:hypothetical protein